MNIDVSDIKKITTQLPTQLYYNGAWHNSSDGGTIKVINPATEETIGEVQSGTPADMQAAIDSAGEAFETWSRTKPRERAEILRSAFEILKGRAEYFAKIITLEHGKAIEESYNELIYSAEFFRWFSEEAVRNYGEFYHSPSSGADILVHHKPAGVAILITPWNFPLAMATRKLGPALAAGCTTVIKPASATPYAMLALVDVLEKAGVPKGVVNIVPSNRSGEVMPIFMNDSRVRVVSFTGSNPVGQTLLKNAAEKVHTCAMELGGNAPFVVLEDANIDDAVEGAMIAKMRNIGESCVGANRFYVHKNVYKEFAEKFTQKMSSLKIGNGLDSANQVGALINDKARQEIHGLVEDAISKGAKLLTGGKMPEGKGYFYPPTVLGEVALGTRLLKEEVFGPVAPIRIFEDEQALLKEVNDTEFGLASYVYAGDTGRGTCFASKIESGMVAVNRGILSDPAAPFGGVKSSGLGREGAREGMLEFLETQYVSVNLT